MKRSNLRHLRRFAHVEKSHCRNRRAKTAEVRVDLQGKQFYVWLGFEVIDEKREAPSPGD